jgi:hypothetical protein
VFKLSKDATATISDVVQKSGETANNFGGGVKIVYKVTSGDGEVTKNWEVKIDGGDINETAKAAFRYFGLDMEQMKPNLGAPDETILKYRNYIGMAVTDRKAAWAEEATADIAETARNAYYAPIFTATKAVAADGKNYTSRVMSGGDDSELETYQAMLDKNRGVGWSYKYNGMWIEVSTTGGSEKEIGIELQGIRKY